MYRSCAINMLLRVAVAGAAMSCLVAAHARAEIAVFANGETMKIESRRVAGEQAVLVLRGGGEIEIALSALEGFVPDEVYEEILQEAPNGSGPEAIRAMAEKAAKRHGIDANLVAAVIGVESSFQPKAVSSKGARGLMQLMPGTAAALGVGDSFDPEENIDGGSRYLRKLLERYRGDAVKALAAYNAGPEAVERHGGVPPYAETRAYVRNVLRRYESESRREK